jgi:eukaryotic-like serine/threonine-protein kinase
MGFSRTQVGPVQFGRYRLTERLGSGGMAVVYRGFVDGPQGFSRSLVIKRILPHLSGQAAFVKMMLAEAKLSALLSHPNIVQVFELGEAEGEYYIAMEHIDGHDLKSLLKQSAKRGLPMSPGLCCFLVGELASALAYAHALKDSEGRPLQIVHRDVSPSNVMVTSHGAIKLLDFGIAKAASFAREELTRTGAVKGKLAYMSPEQSDGLPLDRRSDIFALGIVLHELLTMRRLFRTDDDLQTLRLVREAQVAAPSTINPRVSPGMDAVVLKMLAKAPEHRYQSCDQVAEALAPLIHEAHADEGAMRRWVEELGEIPHKPQPLHPPAADTPTFDDEPPPTPLSQAKTRPRGKGETRTLTSSNGEIRPTNTYLRPFKRGRWLLLGAAAIGAVAFFWIAREPPPAPPPSAAVIERAHPPPAAPRNVKLTVKGTEGATVVVDERVVGNIPLDLDLPSGAGTRAITVRLAGYRPWQENVDAGRDAILSVTLKRAPVVKKPRGEIEDAPKDPFAH